MAAGLIGPRFYFNAFFSCPVYCTRFVVVLDQPKEQEIGCMSAKEELIQFVIDHPELSDLIESLLTEITQSSLPDPTASTQAE